MRDRARDNDEIDRPITEHLVRDAQAIERRRVPDVWLVHRQPPRSVQVYDSTPADRGRGAHRSRLRSAKAPPTRATSAPADRLLVHSWSCTAAATRSAAGRQVWMFRNLSRAASASSPRAA